MRDGGKGDRPRPLSVALDEFDNKWETIFGKNKKLNKPTEFGAVAPKKEGEHWSDDPDATIEECK